MHDHLWVRILDVKTVLEARYYQAPGTFVLEGDDALGFADGSCFFSSRRPHTAYWRDWSSDVCSSDLRMKCQLWSSSAVLARALGDREFIGANRSEERRVGKECRSRWSRYH